MKKRFALFVVVVILSWIPKAFSAELYLSFEQRYALSYLLQTVGLNSSDQKKWVSQASVKFKKMASLEPETVIVSNFEEFLSQWRGQWPDSHSLEVDLQLLHKKKDLRLRIILGNTPALQKQIDDYRRTQMTRIYTVTQSWGWKSSLTVPDVVDLSLLFGDWRHLPQGLLEKQFATLQDVSSQMINLDSGENNKGEKAFALAMKEFVKSYYQELSLQSKKKIVGALLGTDLEGDRNKVFDVMAQNSGPMMQKMLQVMARQSDLPDHLRQTLQRLESGIKPVPWVLAEPLLAPENSGFQFEQIEKKPLGGGSMAQVHRAVLEGVKVVARFLRPGIQDILAEEAPILKRAAARLDQNPEFIATGAPAISSMLDEVYEGIRAELNVNQTIENQKMAFQVYTADVKVHAAKKALIVQFRVPALLEPNARHLLKKSRKSSSLLVQTLANGGKLDKAVVDPKLKKVLVEALVRQWVKVVLFGKGFSNKKPYFYHADLHAGNYLVQNLEQNLEQIQMNLIDYGMAGQLTPEQRASLLLLGVGIYAKRAELIADSLWRVSDPSKNKLNEIELKEKVQSFFAMNAKATLNDWVSFGVREGLKLHYDFVSMNRGIVVLDKTLSEYGSELRVSDIIEKESLLHPFQLLSLMRGQGKMSSFAILKLGASEARKTVSKEMIRSCRLLLRR